jgi:short-subunit dehydrogenase
MLSPGTLLPSSLLKFSRARASRWTFAGRASPPRSVVITGASSGIGKALALCYAREGVALGLLGRNAERLEAVAEQCRTQGAVVSCATIDVRARPDMAQWLYEFDNRTPIDLLIANAGIKAGRAPEAAIEPCADGYMVMEINVLGVLNSVQPVLPRMIARRRGQIGIVSSIAAFVPLPDVPSYCASKSAVLTYGLALRSSLRDCGIGVSVICPGHIMTRMMDQGSGWKPFAISPQMATDLILRGLSRNRATIAFPCLLAFAARLGRLLPDGAQRWALRPFRSSVDKSAVPKRPGETIQSNQ